MNKISKIAILSILLLSGCSYSSMLSHRYENPLNNNSTNSSSYKIEFVVPNDGKGIKEKEFYTSYSDLYDYSYVLDNISKVEDEELKGKLTNIYTSFMSNPYHEVNKYTGKYKDYNIINIIGETLEIRFAHPLLTPNLWNIMNNSMYFENYYVSEFQEGATCNTEFMSHSSLYPVVTSSWSGNMCQNDNTTNDIFKFAMPAQLRANGYDCYYFHLGYRGFYRRYNFIPNFGFEKNKVKFIEDLGINDYVTDENNIKFFEKYIDFSNKFYVSNLTYSMHGGYDANSLGCNNERKERVLKALDVNEDYFKGMEQAFYYLQKFTYFDDYLGDLLKLLEEKGVKDKTIINIYRDHSPYMMNEDHYTRYMQASNPDMNYKKTSIERYNHPLLIYDCGNPKKEVIKNAGSTIDLVPTFLNLLGFDLSNANYKHFMGYDILSGKSLAFISAQSTSKTNDLVIDSNKFKLEYGDRLSFTGETEEQYEYFNDYLIRVEYFINLMKDIVDTNYFEYYYYNVEEEAKENE